MASTAKIHVVSKGNLRDHHVVDLDASTLPELAAGSVRVRTALVSLTANNLLYAQLGNSVYQWWQTYPVPTALPSPYDDEQIFGIVPAWGYAEVLESRVEGLEPGVLLYGYWPTSSFPIDLELTPAKLSGHFIETSSRRQVLHNLYNRYILTDEARAPVSKLDQAKIEAMSWRCVCKTWECGFILNRYLLGAIPIHPLGAKGGKWNSQDADVSKAVVITLSASGKTARGFDDALCNERKAGSGPLGLLAITGRFDGDGKKLLPGDAPFATRTVGYGDATGEETMEWIAKLAPQRVLIVDFGGRGQSLKNLLGALGSKFGDSIVLTVIGVGAEPTVRTEAEMMESFKRSATIKERVQMDTSSVQDTIYEVDGDENFFRELEAGWQRYVQRGNLEGMKLEVRKGVDGLGEGWQVLVDESLKSDVGMAFVVGQ